MWGEVGILSFLDSSLTAPKRFSNAGVMWIDSPWQIIIEYQFGKIDFDVIAILGDNIQRNYFPNRLAML